VKRHYIFVYLIKYFLSILEVGFKLAEWPGTSFPWEKPLSQTQSQEYTYFDPLELGIDTIQ